MTAPLPRRTYGASGHRHTVPEPPGAPSAALRARAASGWERFCRRGEEPPPASAIEDPPS